ncbi:HAMP domain-containing sensor histidine kinase [Falsirhodobacter halotolerans]|uniref:HAMP domain-containing sensor histidine kinase n=1 Tax=Falsirhodobacter halotolerans TaxID=1146892 RepID=UPI001FD631C2|nr:ATP-binding protein [Falsirhodobacter halotolerans]MCJ8138490.1 sensor histidine kinase [Falsirhodobacter halotolerans]
MGRVRRWCRGWCASRLVWRIVGFNLLSLGVILGAMLVLNPTRGMVYDMRIEMLQMQVRLTALTFAEDGTLDPVSPRAGQVVTVFGTDGQVRAQMAGRTLPGADAPDAGPDCTALGVEAALPDGGFVRLCESASVADAIAGRETRRLAVAAGTAIFLSIGLSLLLAVMIARPLRDLAAAARRRGAAPQGRIAIPDLTDRPDEIGHLSDAMRGMVDALYDRIDANERFAADVAHELRNPLASMRSAVDTLRIARDDQRATLLDIIDHDVRRMDRLVTDISNASRLDTELVKEAEGPIDLGAMLAGLSSHLTHHAEERNVRFALDLPDAPIVVQGLEARLAQVFVNLISNAVSFSRPGDTVKLWARQRGNRALVVVEDMGPGIPDDAMAKIFTRFYSERPEDDFGNHSGLGLSIARQIVEAHRGVIWAENIRPEDAPEAPPDGARFVVGLPA